MRRETPARRRGSSLVEFTLAAVPLLLMLVYTFEVARGMWIYHTLAYNVKSAARTASLKGSNCGSPNSCRMTVGTLANQIRGLGLDPAATNVTLNPAAGVSCAPLSNCSSSTALWPPDGSNSPGSTVEINASYNFVSAFGRYTLTARSRQFIQF